MRPRLRYVAMAAVMSLLYTSCYEDKGNYTYTVKDIITITLPEDIKAMSHAEYLNITPTIHSSINGTIDADNTDYEYGCRLNYPWYNAEEGKNEQWIDIDSTRSKDVKFFANLPAGTYKIWYWVKSKSTGVTTNAQGIVKVLSSTYQGWMVLNNVGVDNTVRLDMISQDSKGNVSIARNLLGSKAPKLTGGTQLVLNPSKYVNGESIFLLSRSGGFRLNVNDLQTTVGDDMKLNDFILPSTPGQPVSMLIVNNGSSVGPMSRLTVTDIGNAYAITSNTSGASFENPINTEKRDAEPVFQVSPMMGTSMARPGNSSCALLYDVTNKRFLGWNYRATDNHITFPLNDPEGSLKKFSYQTGMELIAMKSTRYSDGLVYSVLQDDQKKRHVYGINLSGSKFNQESKYEDITAEHFNDATDYAFHSQFPLMFYYYGNKVYSYNLGTGALSDVLTLDASETVTMIKFNLFMNMQLSDLNDNSDEFLGKQYQLIVASTTGTADGGVIRLYKVDPTGKMSKAEEYKGFGKVVDVTYRERRK